MADGRGKELTQGDGNMNGHHDLNGTPQSKSPLSSANGFGSVAKSDLTQSAPTRSADKFLALSNGNTLAHPNPGSQHSLTKMNEIPKELMETLRTRIPDDAYVPMARLIRRAAKTCWSQLITALNELAEIQPPDAQTVTKRMRPPDQTVINDDSSENQRKKMKLWNFAEDHKRALVKLLVILMWSSKSEDNKLTIALNFEIHAIRSAFSNANDKLSEWIVYIVSRQDACPDLDTAIEVLATGRVADVPDLGFGEQAPLTDKQILSTIRRLNRVLTARMVQESDLPPRMGQWHIHDGRVTFRIPHEFELDLSVMTEEPDAPFMLVDLRFDFRPRPPITSDLHDQLSYITNQGLATKGLHGAYEFLHQTCLTVKLKELHVQALALSSGLWNGHLGIELLKRTLIVQYWTRRTVTKSWIEIGINSGRDQRENNTSQPPTSFLYLRWMKNGKLVADHNILFDQNQLSFENVLNQVVAQHIDSTFDGIFETLAKSELYVQNDLDLEQDSSATDAYDCKLRIGISRTDDILLSCDPTAGTIVISPASTRADRLQHELSRSKNMGDDFISRFPALRCALAQNVLTNATQGSSIKYLPGRKPNLAEVRSLFGPEALRAVFFRQPGWASEWTLAASFGRNADMWWLVYESDSARRAHKLAMQPTHLQTALTDEYFDSVRSIASAEITLQASRHKLENKNFKVQQVDEGDMTRLSFSIGEEQGLESVDRKIVVWPHSSKRASQNNAALLVRVKLRASKNVLTKLASAELDPIMTIHVDKQLMLMSLSGSVGDSRVDELLDKVHYIDDLISCIKLVEGIKKLSMRSLTMQDIVIDYHASSQLNLGLKLSFKSTQFKARLQLLPTGNNPHVIVSEHINHILGDVAKPLSHRLRIILSILTATLPLVNGLQYLQGLTNASQVPEMSRIKLEESRPWLKVHIMSRDLVRFGVHFYAMTPDFKKDVDGEAAPAKLLVRLEIETAKNNSDGRQGWIVRPAIEEFRTYIRPSFTSQALAQRLREQVFSKRDSAGWMGFDSAARCLLENPYDLLATVHETLLEWLKEAASKKNEDAAGQPKAVPAKAPLQGSGPVKQNMPQARVQGHNPVVNHNPGQPQTPGQRPFQQARPNGMPQGPLQGGPSRVMTAQPQQIRQPLNAGRGRGQMFPQRGGHNGGQGRGMNGAGGTQHDAIQLD